MTLRTTQPAPEVEPRKVSDPRVAARHALAAYLKFKLPDVDVSEKWPIPGKMNAFPAITVTASDNVKTLYHLPRLWRVIPDPGNPLAGRALYSYGQAIMNLQLDCWEKFEVPRDILARRVEVEINKPPLETLSFGADCACAASAPLQDYNNAPGLVLRMRDYFDTYVEFIFEPIAGSLPESSNVAQAGEWRQVYAAQANLYICNEQHVPLLTSAFAVLDANSDAPIKIQVV